MPIALIVVALLLAVLAPVAEAGAPGGNGMVAFVGERGDEQVVYVRKRGRTIGLLRDRVLGAPAFSPTGRRLAITRELPDVGRAVWIYNVDASSPRQLTAPELSGSHPTWSPSGERLAYHAGPIGQRTIHVVRADGAGDVQLTLGPADQHSPVWSRQNRIAFVQANPGGDDIYRVPAAGGTPRRLTSKYGDDTDPAWSPRGRSIAFVRGTGGIWIMSQWGNGARKVINLPGSIESAPAWSPNGRRILFSAGRPGRRQIWSVKLNGKGLRPLSLPSSNGNDPDWQSVGHDPVIAAAGDITCPPYGRSFNGGLGTRRRCTAMRTSDMLLRRDLWAILPLGDVQTPKGELHYFFQAFGPSWGRLKSLMRPAPGNHDYGTPGAAGYFDYFNGVGERRGPAGDRERGGYYSFDLGKWHLIALDSNCNHVPGGCDYGSPQQRWLERDLARRGKRCTLAYWHHPRYSSVAVEGGRGPRKTIALWQTLHAAGADLVLSAHQHFYERIGPQDGNGNYDEAHGIRSFVVGTGGHSLDDAAFRDPNTRVFDSTTFGILQLTLHSNSYSWRFRGVGPGYVDDQGSRRCH